MREVGSIAVTSGGYNAPQRPHLLPNHCLGHLHGHGLHAALQPAGAVLQPVNRLAQVALYRRAIGLRRLGQRGTQLGQRQVHHGQVNHVAAEHAVVGLPVRVGQQL
jgi:hypothetical protein